MTETVRPLFGSLRFAEGVRGDRDGHLTTTETVMPRWG